VLLLARVVHRALYLIEPCRSLEGIEIAYRLREVGEILGVLSLGQVAIGKGRYVSPSSMCTGQGVIDHEPLAVPWR
jgi:hypothetical protein